MIKFAGRKIKISLTAKDEISKYSAIPPQTPAIDLSFEDFLNFLFKVTTPFYIYTILCLKFKTAYEKKSSSSNKKSYLKAQPINSSIKT